MNFLLFRDFSKNFLIFYEFNAIYLELNSLKKSILRADVAADVARTKERHHMVTYETHHMAHACECVRVCAQVCVSVNREIKLPFQDNVISP